MVKRRGLAGQHDYHGGAGHSLILGGDKAPLALWLVYKARCGDAVTALYLRLNNASRGSHKTYTLNLKRSGA